MTVTATQPIIRYSYTGPGNYTFPFRIFKESDLLVVHTDSEGIAKTLILGTDYLVTFIEDVDGGNIQMINPTVGGGTLEIRRVLPVTQEVDWVNNDPLDAEILEDSFDRLVMMMQQLEVILVEGAATTNWKGEWQPSTYYAVNDIITSPVGQPTQGNLYAAVNAHTSGSDFATDLASGLWQLALDVTEIEDLRDECIALRDECIQLRDQCQNYAQQAANSAADAALYRDQSQVSEANAAISAQNAANCSQSASDSAAAAAGSANDAQLKAWEAEAERLTADSYATQDEDVAVNIYTSNGDGTFTATPTNPAEYSSFHWSKKASSVVAGVASITWTAPLENTGDATDHIARIQPAKVAEWDAALQPGEESLLDVVAGDNITIDKTDPQNPIIASTGGGGGGGGLAWQTEQSVDFLAESGKGYPLKSGVTMTLPAAPQDNDQIGWKDFDNSFHTGEAFIDPNGNPIEQEGDGVMTLNTRGQGGVLVWITDRWLITDVTELNSAVVANKPLMQVQERYASGTLAGNGSNGAWTARGLNNVQVAEISGASLIGNGVQLPAGDYYIEGWAVFGRCGYAALSINHGASRLLGARRDGPTDADGDYTSMPVTCKFSLLAPATITLEYFKESNDGSGVASSLGSPASTGDDEVYAEINVWRLDTEIKKITVQDPEQYLKKPLFQVCRIEPSGTATAGAGIEPLDTILLNEISGADLVANGLSLPAGEYTIDFWCGDQAGSADAGYMYLEDSSGSRKSERFPTGKDHASTYGTARITLSSADVLYLRHVIGTSSEFTAGADTVYAWVKVWAESQVVQAPITFQPINQPITGAYVTGNIFGGELEYIDATNVRVKPVSCMSDDLTTALAIDANTDVLISGIVADTVYNFFIVRYDTAALGIEYDTDVNGANLPANVTHKRWLGPLKTLAGAAEIIPFTMNEDVIWVNTMGEWVIKDAGWTSNWALINADIDAAIPTARVKELVPGFWGGGSTNTEIDLSADNATTILCADGAFTRDTVGRLAWTRDMYGPINPASPLYGRSEGGTQVVLAVRTLRLKR